MLDLISQPWSQLALGDVLTRALRGESGVFDHFDAAVAFVKRSGVQYVSEAIQDFVRRGGYVRLAIGIDQGGTSAEGLSDLIEIVGDRGQIWIVHDSDRYVTFHPKLYLFRGTDRALLIVGSGNLTQGGLYTNDEAIVLCSLDLSIPAHSLVVEQALAALAQWCDPQSRTVHALSRELLLTLIEGQYVFPEARTRTEGDPSSDRVSEEANSVTQREQAGHVLFGRRPGRRHPRRTAVHEPPSPSEIPTHGRHAPQYVSGMGFAMTLMRTDVGVGQTTPGTSRRSPEVFVPLRARDTNPAFWGWPDQFTEDPRRPGKWDRRGVLMRMGNRIISVNMMTWPIKHDFRLRCESLRSSGDVGDILSILTSQDSGYSYDVVVLRAGTPEHERYLQKCVHAVPGRSSRRWGYFTP